MGEWMSAEVHVRVPDDAAIDRWLRATTDRYGFEHVVLAVTDEGAVTTPPIDDLLATAERAEFEWEWEPERRLLSSGGSGELQVNYGLDEWFTDLAGALRNVGWGYHFESAGKYEIPGECWEWMPGWPRERALVQAGESKALDAAGLRAALTEAADSDVDPGDYLTALLAPWPGWARTVDTAR